MRFDKNTNMAAEVTTKTKMDELQKMAKLKGLANYKSLLDLWQNSRQALANSDQSIPAEKNQSDSKKGRRQASKAGIN